MLTIELPFPRVVAEVAFAEGFTPITWIRKLLKENRFDDLLANVDRLSSATRIEVACEIFEYATNGSPWEPFLGFCTSTADEADFLEHIETLTVSEDDYEVSRWDGMMIRKIARAALAHDGRTARRLGTKLTDAWKRAARNKR